MASASPSTETTTATATAGVEMERGEPPAAAGEPKREEEATEMVHKTKLIQFLGRTTPIILQNDNGPCPLLAICNVLLLRNSLNLSPDIPEVSQEKLLSLVAERLIDSNSNVNNKDAGYVENQQQNIADAIDLLPRLTTGIDVNIKFRRIDDFEFTRECAIFDLLDIPLYHGWIVDPQDHETASAIGSNSYNTLMGELVALETQNMISEQQKIPEDDSVDFAAATAAALGVPSPCLSRGKSFDDSPVSVPELHSSSPVQEPDRPRKGDLLEEAELMRVLRLSQVEVVNSSVDDISMGETSLLSGPEESTYNKSSDPNAFAEPKEVKLADESVKTSEPEASTNHDSRALCRTSNDQGCDETSKEEAVSSSGKFDPDIPINQSTAESKVKVVKPDSDPHVNYESTVLESTEKTPSASESYRHVSISDEVPNLSTTVADSHDYVNKQEGCDTSASSCPPVVADSKTSSGATCKLDEPEILASTVGGGEPLYEGEECILESGTTNYQNKEPVYEGEVVLSEQANKGNTACETESRGEMTPKQGDLVRNFLKNSASQLTIYGLFCLQDGIKERELCVFFRNNHFNTMFKFEGELYILVTDQGYINQPELVWEKLNEVNGDTVYMTGNFKEFKVDNHVNSTWDEQNAVASTADYLANFETSVQEHSTFNSDLQLAMALQQQEFEQQRQPLRNNTLQQDTAIGTSRLVTGPQVPRTSAKPASSSFKQELKASKDKCTVM